MNSKNGATIPETQVEALKNRVQAEYYQDLQDKEDNFFDENKTKNEIGLTAAKYIEIDDGKRTSAISPNAKDGDSKSAIGQPWSKHEESLPKWPFS